MTRPTAEWHHGESGPVLRQDYSRIELTKWERLRAELFNDLTPTWTAEPPTEPGWYWCMEPDEYGDVGKRPEQIQRTHDGRLGRYAAFGLREVRRCPDILWHPVPLTPPEAPE